MQKKSFIGRIIKKTQALILVFALMCTFSTVSVYAGESVDTLSLAQTVAVSFANTVNECEEDSPASWDIWKATTLYDFYGNVSAYLFEIKNSSGCGYVIIGDNDGRDPVIEYSFEDVSFIETASKKLLESGGISNPRVFFIGNLDYYIGDADGSNLYHLGTDGVVAVDGSVDSLKNSTTEMNIISLQNYYASTYQDLVGGSSNPPTNSIITSPFIYESGYSSGSSSQVTYYTAGGKYVTTSMFSGYSDHCGAVCGTNLMVYWANRDKTKYGSLMQDSSTKVFKTLYAGMGSNTAYLTFNSSIKSYFSKYANGCSTNYTWFGATWKEIYNGIDENKPVVLLLQNHNVYGDHYVLGVGYEYFKYSNGKESQYIRIADGWSSSCRYVHYSVGYQSGGKIYLIRVYPK